ncbi:putative DNA-binding protein [Pseudonocardia sp. Ae168_Ps1]|uniref:helix-turn-helix domain-containing protein n=1 Tax=unclassified Pseudonocardia TaxID=2619320 RepID=UPI00094B3F50|nr:MULTISPECIES: helix-turn-helix transcriptional regulator [unclassified Pseudonocardia]OLL70009.1 putative DNA-binding protein [Pseudonocardia sp. Ae150A_Ps1]OLL70294.1 putative DNA-binding protein [Pseudonocardia sp. Ae168_Ps1]OLL70744.1 putative DNA-binding protein [Pseudonocardia sp. Ae263_Ps1]OLL89094.1 putative DNA-binding protein [Pseudonocardia sp. Ae356_Ps1]
MTHADIHPQHQRLAARLKELRQAAGLSAAALGEQLGWSQSKTSKMENGHSALVLADIEQWLDTVHADEDVRAELRALAQEAGTRVRPWRNSNRPDGPSQQDARARRDATTSGIGVYQSEVVPGLLQTPDYARRLREIHSLLPAAEIPASVLSLMNRQTVLFDESKQFDLVMTETALRWRPGPASVMLAQLDRIAALASLPNVRIGVLSRETQERAEARPLHSFVLLRYDDAPTTVEIETLTAEQEVTDPADVKLYEQFLAEQQRSAEHGPALLALLDRLRADLSSNTPT